MMEYAYFPGCKIPHHLPEYGQSVQSVCSALGIELLELEFNCCGYPMRQEDELASIYSAFRNFVLAESAGLPILTPCKCCFGNLKYAQSRVHEDAELAKAVDELLKRDGLDFPEDISIYHLLTCIDRDVGADTLKGKVVRSLEGVKVACHYGCHALRPANVTGFDDPFAPTVFERLMSAVGADVVDWDLRLECCGYPLRGRDEVISNQLMLKKMENAADAGAGVVATGCTYCQLQFVNELQNVAKSTAVRELPEAVLFTELLAWSLGATEASSVSAVLLEKSL